MDADRFGEARPLLAASSRDGRMIPRSPIVSGSARTPRGHPAAIAAWSRVNPRSAWGVRAGLARARTLVGDLGRYGEAEVSPPGVARLNPAPRMRFVTPSRSSCSGRGVATRSAA